MYRVAFLYSGHLSSSAYTFSPSSDNENFCVYIFSLLLWSGVTLRQKYQFVRSEKNTKYARGTNTLNLKKKIMKYVQSEFLKKPSTECMYYFRIMHAVVKLFSCGNNCTFTYLLFIYLEFGIRWGF